MNRPGSLAALCLWFSGPGGWQGALLAIFALDWAAGTVANAARSTRAYCAELPVWVSVLFGAIHVFEVPILWWLVGGTDLFGWMLLLLTIKMALFICGQIEMRTRKE
ncbi:MAG: hypothetical protein INF52_12060 [Rhodobacter sp.]|nr:hypothetical protein [Rhodobacter sp.]